METDGEKRIREAEALVKSLPTWHDILQTINDELGPHIARMGRPENAERGSRSSSAIGLFVDGFTTEAQLTADLQELGYSDGDLQRLVQSAQFDLQRRRLRDRQAALERQYRNDEITINELGLALAEGPFHMDPGEIQRVMFNNRREKDQKKEKQDSEIGLELLSTGLVTTEKQDSELGLELVGDVVYPRAKGESDIGLTLVAEGRPPQEIRREDSEIGLELIAEPIPRIAARTKQDSDIGLELFNQERSLWQRLGRPLRRSRR